MGPPNESVFRSYASVPLQRSGVGRTPWLSGCVEAVLDAGAAAPVGGLHRLASRQTLGGYCRWRSLAMRLARCVVVGNHAVPVILNGRLALVWIW